MSETNEHETYEFMASMLSDEERAEIAAEENRRAYWEKYPNRLRSISDLRDRPRDRMLFKGAVPSAGLAMLYGASYSGKSFGAVDLMGAVALGRASWLDFKAPGDVRPRHVVYVAAEGGQEFADQIFGYIEGHQLAAEDREVLERHVHVLDADATSGLQISLEDGTSMMRLNEEIDLVCGKEGPALIVLDPQINVLADVEENDNASMGKIYDRLRAWAKRNGFLVLLIHHTGHSGANARGASAMKGALHLQIKMRPTKDGGVLEFEKVKGAQKPSGSYKYAIRSAPLGADEDGDPITGGYVEWQGLEESRSKMAAEGEAENELAEQHVALTVLGHVRDGLWSQNKITAAMSLGKVKVQKLVKRLEEDGLIENNGPGKSIRWDITDAGLAKLDEGGLVL